MKRLAIALVALFLAAAEMPAQGRFANGRGRGLGSGFGQASAWPDLEARVIGAPYSAVRTTLVQQTLANGNQIVRQVQAKVYRDSQGRFRIEQMSTNSVTGQTRTSVTINDPVAGMAYTLNSEAKTYSRTPGRMFARPTGTAGGSGYLAGPRWNAG
jgi:hypothetical protein